MAISRASHQWHTTSVPEIPESTEEEFSDGPPVLSTHEDRPASPSVENPESRGDDSASSTHATPAVSPSLATPESRADAPVSSTHEDCPASPSVENPESRDDDSVSSTHEDHPVSSSPENPESRGDDSVSSTHEDRPVSSTHATPETTGAPPVSSPGATPTTRPQLSETRVKFTITQLLTGLAVVVAIVWGTALWITFRTNIELERLNSELNALKASVGNQTSDIKELRNGINNMRVSVAEPKGRLEEKSASSVRSSEERFAKPGPTKPTFHSSGEAATAPSYAKTTRVPLESLAKEELRYLLDVTSTRCALRGSEASLDEKNKCTLEIERIKSALGRAESPAASSKPR